MASDVSSSDISFTDVSSIEVSMTDASSVNDYESSTMNRPELKTSTLKLKQGALPHPSKCESTDNYLRLQLIHCSMEISCWLGAGP